MAPAQEVRICVLERQKIAYRRSSKAGWKRTREISYSKGWRGLADHEDDGKCVDFYLTETIVGDLKYLVVKTEGEKAEKA